MDSGLVALNGIPGSGKTLDAVNIALSHYKSENRWYKYYISYFKYILIKTLKNNDKYNNFIIIFNMFRFKLQTYKFLVILLKLILLFIKFILLLFIYSSSSLYIKLFIICYFLFFKKIINSINDLDYKYFCLFPHRKINNIYSSFPILLDRKNNIWSNRITLFDLMNNYSFLPNSKLIIDEIQLFIDSDEFKDKEKNKIISKIGKFLQAHRHFGIKQIIFTSQSPSRIFKKGRNIVIGYLKQDKIINLPFLPLSIMRGTLYYDFEFYGRYIPRDREERRKLPFNYRKIIKIFNRNKVYSAYDSRYLSKYNYGKPLLNLGTWDDYKVSNDYLEKLFEKNEF